MPILDDDNNAIYSKKNFKYVNFNQDSRKIC